MVRPSDPPAIIEFGRFGILPHRRQLLADGRPIRLGGRAFDLLLALIEAPGAVVGKDELLSRIWPGRIVEENRLQSEIWALRKAFGADRDLIQTVAGRGYQFTGEIRELGAGVSARQVAAPLAVPASPSPATNPSENVSEPIGREAALSEVTDHVTRVARRQPLESARRGSGHEARCSRTSANHRHVVRSDRRGGARRRDRSRGFARSDRRLSALPLGDRRSPQRFRRQPPREQRPRPFRLSRGARARRRAGYPRRARIMCGGQDPETRCRRADAVPGRHSDRNGHRWRSRRGRRGPGPRDCRRRPRLGGAVAAIGATGHRDDRADHLASDRQFVRLPRSRRTRHEQRHRADTPLAGAG